MVTRVVPAVVAHQLEVVRSRGILQLVDVGRRDVVGERHSQIDVDTQAEISQVKVWLPDDWHQHRVDVARISQSLRRRVLRREIGIVRVATLHKFDIGTHRTDKGLHRVVTPRDTTRVAAPHHSHLLLGIEACGRRAPAALDAKDVLSVCHRRRTARRHEG